MVESDVLYIDGGISSPMGVIRTSQTGTKAAVAEKSNTMRGRVGTAGIVFSYIICRS